MENLQNKFGAIVIGAGASRLLSALVLAREGKKVLMLEVLIFVKEDRAI